MLRRLPILPALLCGLLAPAAIAAVTPPAETLYTDALAKERAVRTALEPSDPAETVLKAVRTVVRQYDLLVRSYPTSGYCDDALWQAGQLSLVAFEKFGEAQDRDAAVRLLRSLASQYPSSKFAKQVPGELTRAGAMSEARGTAGGIRPAAVAADAPVPVRTTTAASSAKPSAVATIKDIRRAVLADVVRITIELDAEVQFHEERLSNPPRVFVDLTGARAAPPLLDQTLRFDGDSELVRQIRLGRHPNNTTRVVLEADGVSSFSVYPLYSPYRLVIDCVRPAAAVPAVAGAADKVVPAAPRGADAVVSAAARADAVISATARGAEPPTIAPSARALTPPRTAATLLRSRPVPNLKLTPWTPPPAQTAELLAARMEAAVESGGGESAAAPPAAVNAASVPPPARNINGGFSVARQLGLGVNRIVIDPGHGGHDPGTRANGITEADLVLDIALRLEALLTKVPGVEVVLTRRSDEFVDLQERTAVANREGADLFLSIHANASATKSAAGIETYFLNFSTNSGAMAVAARENAGADKKMGALTDILNAISLNTKLDESRDLATMVQRAMIEKLKPANRNVRDRGVNQALFQVLIGASMPSVLTEVSFLTNAQEAKLLKNSTYRQRIADALFAAIRKYQTSLKSTSAIAQGG